MNILLQDVRYGLRTLLKSPAFTLIAVLSLALGIGANTAIFSLIGALMLKQLPVHEPNRLVLFGPGIVSGVGDSIQPNLELLSEPAFREVRKRKRVFTDAAAIMSMGLTLPAYVSGASTPERLGARLVSSNFFSVLGVNPAAGHLFNGTEDAPLDAHADIVLSYAYWARRFHSSRSAIGSSLRIGDRIFTVIGVAAPEFFGVTVGEAPEVWVPLSMESAVPPFYHLHGDMDQSLWVIARLQPGITIQQANAAEQIHMRQVIAQLAKPTPGTPNGKALDRMQVQLTPVGRGLSDLRRNYSVPLQVMMVLVGLVLLIACANVANLLLARATARQKEMAVRLAVGSGRVRIVRLLLTESVLLSALGGAAGVLVAIWGSEILLSLVSAGPDPVPLTLSPDLPVLLFTLGISLGTALLFGIAPAFRASAVDPNNGLREGRSGTATRGRMFSSRALVAAQVAISLILLVTAGLFIQSFRNIEAIPTGFHRDRVLVFSLDTASSGLKEDASLLPLYRHLRKSVGKVPGVSHSALAFLLFNEGAWTTNLSAEGHPELGLSGKMLSMNVTSPGYLDATGIPLLAGRFFNEHDTAASPHAIVLNEKAARDIFGPSSPLGRHMALSDTKTLDLEVVGVAGNAKYGSLREETPAAGYLPLAQKTQYADNLIVSYRGDPAPIIQDVRKTIVAANSNLPVTAVTTTAEQVDRSIHTQLLVAQLSSFFGALALLLAAIGLYGVLSYSVARRTSEIGVRMALGAQASGVLWMILRETLVLVGAGILIGIPVAMLASRLIASLLYRMHAVDLVTMITAIVVLATVGAFAGLLPARRAASVDPLTSLRYE